MEGGNQGAMRVLVGDIKAVYGSDNDGMVLSPSTGESTRICGQGAGRFAKNGSKSHRLFGCGCCRENCYGGLGF